MLSMEHISYLQNVHPQFLSLMMWQPFYKRTVLILGYVEDPLIGVEGQILILGVISQGFHCICIFWGGRGKYTVFYSNIEALFT